jgi:hypothetical protein
LQAKGCGEQGFGAQAHLGALSGSVGSATALALPNLNVGKTGAGYPG